jgi:predicted dehydrogenase
LPDDPLKWPKIDNKRTMKPDYKPKTRFDRTGPRSPISRRQFLQQAAAGLAVSALTVVPRHVLGGQGQIPPSEKITLAGIGLGGQGTENMVALQKLPEVQVVAVCDVNREGGGYQSWYWSEGNERRVSGREPGRRLMDELYAKGQRSGQYRGCKAYADYRELLAQEEVDAVMVATPDHTHAAITMAALKRGKHVYCEKPLTYSVYEARQVAEAARKAKVATQCGNQGQATEAARVTCEIIADGAIGQVHEVQVWSGPRFWSWPTWEGRPPEQPPVPEGLDWDLWLGPAPVRPYHPAYLPWTWRNWRDFGTGLLGDLGLHKLSTVFKALDLGHPVTIEGSATKLSTETYPLGEIVRFEFPARGDRAPVTVTWYDGGLKPFRPTEFDDDDVLQDVIYIGDKGKLMGNRLIPEAQMDKYKVPSPTLPRSTGHYQEWVSACRGGPAAGSNFVDHSALVTEVCLLGNIAVRGQKKLKWDGASFRFTNDQAANRLLHREYRQGWSL